MHQECGLCTSKALYEIIQQIKPQVIFEELSIHNYIKSYEHEELITMETDAIKMYLLNNVVEHIPVDTFEYPKKYDDDLDYLYNRMFNGGTRESHSFRRLIDNRNDLLIKHGFSFLNSDYQDQWSAIFNRLKNEFLQIRNEERLLRIDMANSDTIENRENEMLNNIYHYCEQYTFETALFFIGSGHRITIMPKIRKRLEQNEQEITWKFFEDLYSGINQ